MEQEILKAKNEGDSVGGIVQLEIKGLQAGIGDPVFFKLDARLAMALFSIGAVKGVEFGDGFELAKIKGSEANDQMDKNGFLSNRSGGILGGISTGEDIIIKIGVKPTPSINIEQKTVDIYNNSHSIKTEGEKAKIPSKEINSIIENFTSDITSNSDAYLNLLEFFEEDALILSHSVNVTTISMLLAISLKYEMEKITTVGIAALLHDIGKLFVPEEILKKKEKLSEEEWETIKKHPIKAYETLKNLPELPQSVLIAILTHHEQYAGGGYPFGINHEKLSTFSQIISIADVFDASTSPKSYRDPLTFDEAFNYIMENSGKKFNPTIAQVFLRDMAKKINEEPIYPIGSFLLLNTGEIGIVINHRLSPYTLRPIVDIFLKFDPVSKKQIYLKIPIQVDLEKDYQRHVIKKITDPQKIENFRKILNK